MDIFLILLVACFALNLFGIFTGGGFISLLFVIISGYFLYQRLS